MSVFRRRSRCWLIDMASSRKKPARRRSRWESLYAVMWFMNSFSGRSGQAFKLDMHAKWRCMPLTWPIGLRVPGASWVFVFFFLFFRLFIYYIYIYIWRHGDQMEITFPARCPQIMLLKQCIRRAVQEGLKIYIQVLTRFFFPFSNSVHTCKARPFDVPCSFWRCCTWWTGDRCEWGDQAESWTDTFSGGLECSVIYIYICYLSLIFENSCMQDEAAMDVISPSSSASEKEPIKDSNQCQPFLERKKQGQVYIIINLFLFESEDVSPLQPSTSASARDKAHWQSCRARSMMNLPHRIQYAL